MTDKPIIFSGPMVRALLREIEQPRTGKTQTRRLAYERPAQTMGAPGVTSEARMSPWARLEPGERLWVREAWSGPYTWRDMRPRDRFTCGSPQALVLWYWADGGPDDGDWEKPRPSIHMPRWASRITLIVTDVRVQRLQDISEADAIAEGIERLKSGRGYYDPTVSKALVRGGHYYRKAAHSFEALWNSLHGPGAWDANPWVAAITFRPVPGNIDQIGGQR